MDIRNFFKKPKPTNASTQDKHLSQQEQQPEVLATSSSTLAPRESTSRSAVVLDLGDLTSGPAQPILNVSQSHSLLIYAKNFIVRSVSS